MAEEPYITAEQVLWIRGELERLSLKGPELDAKVLEITDRTRADDGWIGRMYRAIEREEYERLAGE